MRALVFPGQGAQTIGMGKALAETYPVAAAVFGSNNPMPLSYVMSKFSIWSFNPVNK